MVIVWLCFDQNALLVKEYQHIFHDLFGKRSELYQEIAALLATTNYDYSILKPG